MNFEFLDMIVDITQVLVGIFAFVTLIILLVNQKRSRSNNFYLTLSELRKEEHKVRMCMSAAEKEVKELEKYLKNNTNITREIFYDVFGGSSYENLRKIAYFYEYLGIMVYTKSINFKIIFFLFSFPDNFWKKTAYIRNVVINSLEIVDFWQFFAYIENRYRKQRYKQYLKFFKRSKGIK